MKPILAIIAFAALAVGLLLWRGGGVSGTEQKTVALSTGVTSASISDSIPLYNFGPVSMLKGNVEHTFAIKNTANENLVVTRAETSCMCTRAVLILPEGKEMGPFGMPGHGFNPSFSAVIRSGETVAVRVVFDPAAHGPAGIGRIERAVTLATNKGPLTMQFRAQVMP